MIHKNQYFFENFKKPIDKKRHESYNEGVIHKMNQTKSRMQIQKEGGNSMTNTELLEKKISESGKKKEYLASKCGLSRQGFKNCITNKAYFNTKQVKILCAELNIVSLKEREAIFFAH